MIIMTRNKIGKHTYHNISHCLSHKVIHCIVRWKNKNIIKQNLLRLQQLQHKPQASFSLHLFACLWCPSQNILVVQSEEWCLAFHLLLLWCHVLCNQVAFAASSCWCCCSIELLHLMHWYHPMELLMHEMLYLKM